MYKDILIDLAEDEVFESDQFDLNPEVRNFKSFFSKDICPRKNDLQTAISFYESLSDEEIFRRYSVQYWESCALGAFDALYDEAMGKFYRSIDRRELARREIKNIALLLNEGKYQIIPNKEHILINEIPVLYEKLITGTWLADFFDDDEMESYQTAQEESSQQYFNSLAEINKKHKENSRDAHIELIKQSMNNGPKYIDHFNATWVTAMQIQALIWYKAALEKIMIDGESYLAGLAEESKEYQAYISRSKGMSMTTLRRSNDGYEAITTSFEDFVSKHKRNPQWGELMLYMIEYPPNGFTVSGTQRGQKVSELNIEGIEKPLDREAFRKRFERYFKKTDNKQDNS